MLTTLAFSAFIAVSCGWIGTRAVREHRDALAERRGLLDDAAGLLQNSQITFGPDQFPVLVGQIGDGRRAKIELIADTMVTRRLPQLWLRVTLSETREYMRPTIGALARPTGAEYYSLVHDMSEWMSPPETDASLLMRGDGRATAWQIERVSALLRSLFADPKVKEAVITPRGTRIIRQAAQGEPGAHKVLRQVRFPLTAVPADLVALAIAEAETLSALLVEVDIVAPVYEAA
ncbi:hypothetical protein EDC40_108184 [Aminobacter aminovorans]|uniref:Uncharacterized protein n=1 Tax=Aminobacter aminovorans TaxID=83263 RepID=A0A381INK9_AMIAI|nr:hypothetical protein [Aminobacter aminovorans]TCS24645.1 hypothetical protein EDC40_108184 [Aminobacter aminovorans]SUY29280.1 Uncharacterised protein [Aminobacter aminovorans]